MFARRVLVLVYVIIVACGTGSVAAVPPVPKISAAPVSVNLGAVTLGATSSQHVITIKNTGQIDLTINGVAITGTDADEFAQTGACGTIQPAGSCQVGVTFTPHLPYGQKSAVLGIASNDPKKPALSVKLIGQTPPPVILATPATMNFGKLPWGTTSASKTVTVKDNGLNDLVVSSATVSGTDPDDFSPSSDCGALSHGGSCTIDVLFTPQERGVTRSAILTISSNDPKRPALNLKLSGQGALPSSSKAITAYSFKSPAAKGAINESAKTITVGVPHGTNVTALVATFTTSGASVTVGNTVQTSGATPNDFSNPVAYVVTAADGSTATYTVTVTALAAVGKYAYVANNGSNTVSQYTIGANGSLTPMSTPVVAAGVGPFAVTVTPSGDYAYVANFINNTVSQYTVGANGGLIAMSTPAVAAGVRPAAVAVHPAGRYVYVTNYGSNTVSQYAIGANGGLTPMNTPAVAAGVSPAAVTVHPSGNYAYVANKGGTTVSQYTIDANGGLIAMGMPAVSAGVGPSSVIIHPSGNYAYVTNDTSNTVSQYAIDANGSLNPMSTPAVAAGVGPSSVIAHPSGNYAYVANYANNTVSQYTVGASGGLIAMGTPTVAAGLGPISVTVDPTGTYVYVVNYGSGTVSQYTVAANGGLIAMGAPTVAAGVSPSSIIVAP